LLNKLPRDTTPALFQRLTKALPLLFSYAVVIVLRVAFKHEFLEMPPEVFNRVEIR
jgi:hypothetical protein